MSRQPSEKTQLAALRRELKAYDQTLVTLRRELAEYRGRASKAEQEVAEWKVRFDTLMKLTGRRMLHPQEGLPIGGQPDLAGGDL